jgi:exodeoxyribonuclease V beta subunit
MNSSAIALDALQLPLRGLRLIEASAGTGKTWTIAALYVRLVLGHGDDASGHGKPLLPPDILVVTFTEAATLELRERIRHRLYDAARCFRGQAKPDAFLQLLIVDCDAEQRLRYGLMLQVAADWMDEAAIYTIHGWCNRMLRQHAFDSGSLFKQELEAGDPQLLADVVRDYWRKFFYPLDGHQVAAVSRFASTPDALLAKVKALLQETEASWHVGDQQQTIDVEHPQSPDQLLGLWRDWQRQRVDLEATARQTWLSHKSELEDWLREASTNGWLNGTTYQRKSFDNRLLAMAAWAEHGAACDGKWLSGFAQSRIKMNQKHQDKLLQHSAFAALDPLADHLDAEPSIDIDLSLHARQWIRRTYAERKHRRARLDYDDLLLHLDAALQGDNGQRLAEVIRSQYPLAMIDEFQDTDPLQYRIFHSVYRRDADDAATGLLLIGDPKQAIYAFRGADIHTYLQAKQDAQGQVYTLTRNFRSTQALVDAVNQVFNHAEQHPAGAFKFAVDSAVNPLPYWPIEAEGRKERFVHQGQAQAALSVWHQPSADGADSCAMAKYLQTMAQATASQIVELLNGATDGNTGFRRDSTFQALQAADIAILVRSRREAGIVRQALSERGLRSVYLSDRDSVYASQEAVDVLRWLQACAEPEQPRLLRAALASNTLNLSLAQLERFNSDELHWESKVELFKTLQGIWRQQGVLAMLRHLLTEFQLPQQLLAASNGERVLTNLLHLSELLQTASVELDGEQALIRHLLDCITDGTQDDDSLLRLESDSGLIKVVTLHKSKGLEYPLVFLPFICSFREVTGKSQYYRYHDADGAVHIDLGKAESSKQQADNERLQEDLRLLYVGLTRARHTCWLGIAAVKVGNSDKCQLHKSAMGYLLAGGNSIQAGELSTSLQAMAGDCPELSISEPPASEQLVRVGDSVDSQLAPARHYSRGRLQRWWIASYSALRLADDDARIDAVDAPETARQANLGEHVEDRIAAGELPLNTVLDKHGFPRGSQAGVFLHSLLESAALTGFSKLAGDAELRAAMVTSACERRGWQSWTTVVEQWLLEILTLPIALPNLTLSLSQLPRQSYQAELEFWFASRQVDSQRLDALICLQLLPNQARPALQRQQLDGMLKGFADLVFERQGRYYLIDYKSNHLGGDDAAYDGAALCDAILQHRYDIQACLYLLALQRLLKARLGEAYDYERHIGGAVFWFLRGIDGAAQGVQLLRPPQSLIDELDALFAGRELVNAG